MPARTRTTWRISTSYAQLGLRLPADLAMRLRQYCASTGRSVNATVQEALVRDLDAEERRGKRA